MKVVKAYCISLQMVMIQRVDLLSLGKAPERPGERFALGRASTLRIHLPAVATHLRGRVGHFRAAP